MKCTTSIALLLSCALTSTAQDLEKLQDLGNNYNKIINCDNTIKPLSNKAFDRYLTNHYSYTILGDASPSTGVKVGTSTPSISLKAPLFKDRSNSFISTLELQAGTDTKLFEVFSENKISSTFKATLGLNFLLPANWANFKSKNQYILCNLRENGNKKYADLLSEANKTAVLEALMDQMVMDSPDEGTLRKILNNTKIPDSDIKSAIQELAKALTIPTDGIDPYTLISQIANSWKAYSNKLTEKEAFLKTYNTRVSFNRKMIDSLYNFEIQQVEKLYTKRFVWWINASPYVSNTNFKQYNVSAITLVDNSSFLYGIKASLNAFWKFTEPHKFAYLVLSVIPQKLNSLDELTKYSYKKSTEIKFLDPAKPNDKETISKEEPGTAYEGIFRSGYGTEILAEAYLVPWNQSYIPGFFAKASYSSSEHRLNKERTAVYLGLVWNITNSDKTVKNLVSILPYAGWSNLSTQYKDESKSKIVPLHDLFTAGIQIGIPINIKK